MSLLDDLLADLVVEGDALRETVGLLDAEGWRTPTPAAGWTIATQVAHLAWTDEAATAAAAAAGGDATGWDEVLAEGARDPDGFVDAVAEQGALLPPADLLETWDAARAALPGALRAVPEGARMPWFGPPMSAASMATARFMETWAHGLDVHHALGTPPQPSDRIRHVAHLGTRTRDFAYAVRGETPPAEPFRVELVSPSGQVWVWGPDDAAQSVRGSAHDFCLLVTQRVHRADTDLVAVGADAEHWLGIAQAFAGAPGAGRDPRA